MSLKLLLNNLVKRTSWFYEGQFKDCEKFWNGFGHNLDVINLGSNSGMYAFDYSETSIKAANLATGPQPLIMDYGIFLTYGDCLKKGGSVLIPLCPFSSMVGAKIFVENRYYSILPDKFIPDAQYKQRKLSESYLNDAYKYYPLFQLYVESKKKAKELFLFKKKDNDINFIADAKRWVEDWKAEFSIINLDDPITSKNLKSFNESSAILNKLLHAIINKGYKPCIVIPPISSELSAELTIKMRQSYITNYIERARQDISVPFYSYIDDQEFSNDHSLFMNSFLMNKKGAKLFTKRVLKDLNLIY